MYGEVLGATAPVAPVVAGIAVLPNTGGNQTLFVVAIVTVIVGSLIILTSVARIIAKKAYKA